MYLSPRFPGVLTIAHAFSANNENKRLLFFKISFRFFGYT